MTGPVTDAWLAYQDRLLRRCFCCGEWAYDVADCASCGAPASSHPRPVREHRLTTSREYLDLLAIADAQAHPQTEEQTA